MTCAASDTRPATAPIVVRVPSPVPRQGRAPAAFSGPIAAIEPGRSSRPQEVSGVRAAEGKASTLLSRSPSIPPGAPAEASTMRTQRACSRKPERQPRSWPIPPDGRLRRRHGERPWRGGACWTTCRSRSARSVSPATGPCARVTLRPAARPAATGWGRRHEGEWRDDTYVTRLPLSRMEIASSCATVIRYRTEIPRPARNTCPSTAASFADRASRDTARFHFVPGACAGEWLRASHRTPPRNALVPRP